MQSSNDKNILEFSKKADGGTRKERDIIAKIGNVVYTFQKGDPEWDDWKKVASYDDPEMVYDLMAGEYVEEYKALISRDITDVIAEEAAPGSDWSELLEEAEGIYDGILARLKGSSDKCRPMGGTVFEEFHALVHDVVRVYYRSAFSGQSEEEIYPDVRRCHKEYNKIILTLLDYKKYVTPSADMDGRGIDWLIAALNMLLKRFYGQSLKYGGYFREYNEKIS